jgi:hypothetical protein
MRNQHPTRKNPRASGRPSALTGAVIAAIAAEYGNPRVPAPDTPAYKAALEARDTHWRAMPENLPNAEQMAWIADGWRRFYASLTGATP